jgi:hypothetical protein
MEDDDPEKRIRELERGLAGPTAFSGGLPYDTGIAPVRRRVPLAWRFLIVAAMLASLVVAIAVGVHLLIGGVRHMSGGNGGNGGSGVGAPITLPHGGALTAGGNGTTDTYGCNDGNLTVSANNSAIKVSGHCASLKVSGFDNHLNVDNSDTVEVSGFNNTVTETACNDGKLTFSGYGNAFTAGGHCGSLAVSNYGNRVQLDNIDTIAVTNYGNRITVTGHCGSLKVSAYDNQVQIDTADTIDASGFGNTVTYHSGSPKVTKSGTDITVKQG